MTPDNRLAAAGTAIPISVAPMMDRTDRHFRVFVRKITRRTLLYSEMVTSAAVIHGDRDYLIGFSPEEKPLSLQLAGDDPKQMAECAHIAEDMGYDEVNINAGCPSPRVQKGGFGACLMLRPETVAECVAEMRAATHLPVTVKHRIGVDERDSYADLLNFVDVVATAGCDRFTVHARKAVLDGLSAKDNRRIPPLRADDVHRLKRDRPKLVIEINGGIVNLDQADLQLSHVDAVMIGRAAYDNVAILAEVDHRYFNEAEPDFDRHAVIEALLPYVEAQVRAGVHLNHMSRHLLSLFAGRRGTRQWKRWIAEHGHLPGSGAHTLVEALAQVPRHPT